MAEKRMFTKKITDADEFISLPSSTQALYLHLCMSADDDGFNNQVQMAMFKAHASIDDVKILLTKRFILQFESGVIVIKHWRMANALRKDRYTETAYQEELKQLKIKDNGSYTVINGNEDGWLPDGCQMVAADKNSIDKNSKDKNIYIVGEPTAEKPKKEPCMEKVEEILNYLNEKTGKKFTSRSKSSVKMIKDRLREGYVVDEFKAVIDNKVAAWGNNPDMKIYLRPETLFRPSHFDSYLNDVEDERQKRKREEQEINERQRKAIKDADLGIFDSV